MAKKKIRFKPKRKIILPLFILALVLVALSYFIYRTAYLQKTYSIPKAAGCNARNDAGVCTDFSYESGARYTYTDDLDGEDGPGNEGGYIGSTSHWETDAGGTWETKTTWLTDDSGNYIPGSTQEQDPVYHQFTESGDPSIAELTGGDYDASGGEDNNSPAITQLEAEIEQLGRECEGGMASSCDELSVKYQQLQDLKSGVYSGEYVSYDSYPWIDQINSPIARSVIRSFVRGFSQIGSALEESYESSVDAIGEGFSSGWNGFREGFSFR